MKLLLSSLLMLSVLVVGTAYAEIKSVDVTANNKLVDIIIYGTEPQVYLTIWDSEDQVMIDGRYMPIDKKDGGLFRYTLPINEFNGYGDYTGQITHGNDVHDFSFSFKEKIDPTLTSSELQSSNEMTQHEQNIERLQLEIQKKDNKIAELENQVFDLQKELDNLNMIIREQIKVIMDTLVSLKN